MKQGGSVCVYTPFKTRVESKRLIGGVPDKLRQLPAQHAQLDIP